MTATPDGNSLLDPGLTAMLGAFSLPDITGPEILAGIRAGMSQTIVAMGSTDAVERTDHLVPGDHPVPVRVHRPRGVEGPLPCVYAIHGGGMILGTYDMDDSTFEAWCQELGVMGVSVEYRLAPEFPFPAPLDDCERGLLWAVEHADELGIDLDRLGVFGISAGAGLAAGLAIRVRDNGGPALAFQLLETPMLDDRQITASSTTDDLLIWSNASNTLRLARLPRRPLRRRRAGRGGAGPGGRPRRPAADLPVGRHRRRLPRRDRSPTRSASPRPACPPSCTCTRACPTGSRRSSTTPSCRTRPPTGATGCAVRSPADR